MNGRKLAVLYQNNVAADPPSCLWRKNLYRQVSKNFNFYTLTGGCEIEVTLFCGYIAN